MLTPKPRGALSGVLFEAMRTQAPSWDDVLGTKPDHDDDAQIALWSLYELHYRGFDDVDDRLEWQPELLRLRRDLEQSLEARLRERFEAPEVTSPFADAFFDYVASHDGRSLASFVHRDADADQVRELLSVRTIYHLKESDPSAWLVPRLAVEPQAALMELQYDEYGAGDPNRLHAHLFARGLEACGLRSGYGAYIDDVPCEVLEQNNAMSLFGLHRRLRGAALGHLAAFEATSSLPSRRMSQGLDRLGFPREMIDYYDEHVEADAVHEQLAVRVVCGTLLDAEPSLVDDVFFGAFTCLDLEDRFAGAMLEAWAA
ncbi:iron-containing redox enzyme family protein [Aeromicrobium sp.]|uniref:iron-containing redox enzyme family protein n=1 Tax=Aeromicrobium sp. TaxID=1871063 RepID=UPI003C394658